MTNNYLNPESFRYGEEIEIQEVTLAGRVVEVYLKKRGTIGNGTTLAPYARWKGTSTNYKMKKEFIEDIKKLQEEILHLKSENEKLQISSHSQNREEEK